MTEVLEKPKQMNVLISYKDSISQRHERYEAGPYHPKKAVEMKKLLLLMGCRDFLFHPTPLPAIYD